MTAAEMVLDREMREAFAALEARDGTVPSESIQKIREGEHWPWRVFARRIVEAHAAGVSQQNVLRTVMTMAKWVYRLYDTHGETVTESVELFQGPRLSGPHTRVA